MLMELKNADRELEMGKRGVAWPRAASSAEPWGCGTARCCEGSEASCGSEPASSRPRWQGGWGSVRLEEGKCDKRENTVRFFWGEKKV